MITAEAQYTGHEKHNGERVTKSHGFSNVHHYLDPPADKQVKQLEDGAVEASQEGNPVSGMKGLLPLSLSLITSSAPDYRCKAKCAEQMNAYSEATHI